MSNNEIKITKMVEKIISLKVPEIKSDDCIADKVHDRVDCVGSCSTCVFRGDNFMALIDSLREN